MFALVRDLAAGRDVTEIAVEPTLVRRHLLAPLAAKYDARFRDDLVRATIWWARAERELPELTQRLLAAGTKVAAIKGASYATWLYARPIDRPMTDIDLLVSAPRVAEGVLVRAGFVRERSALLHHATAWVRRGLVIDLHRNIIGAGRSGISLSSVWARARQDGHGGTWRLDPSDELVFHLVHMARCRLSGPLVQVVDAARLLEKVDEVKALARADAWGVGRPARIALAYCRDVLSGVSRPGGWLAPRMDNVLERNQPGTLRKLLFDVATAGSARQLAARIVAYGASRLAGRPRGE